VAFTCLNLMGYTMTFNTKLNLANFSRSLGNGATMGREFSLGLQHAISTGNTNHIAALYSAAKAKNGGDNQAMRSIKMTIDAIYSGNDTKPLLSDPKELDKPVSIKIKGCLVNQDMVAAMKKLVSDKSSMRGKTWADTFKSDADKPKKTVEQCQQAVEKFLQKLMADNDVNISGSVTVTAQTLQITQEAA